MHWMSGEGSLGLFRVSIGQVHSYLPVGKNQLISGLECNSLCGLVVYLNTFPGFSSERNGEPRCGQRSS